MAPTCCSDADTGRERAMNGLEEKIREYLRLRRALGFTLERDERLLGQFAAHLTATGARTITVEAALAWAVLPGGAASYHGTRLAVVRKFLHWLKAFEPGIEVPPAGLLPVRVRRAVPYQYSPAQVRDLMIRAGQARSPLKAATYSTLIGLLACTGLRVGEAIRADTGDLNDGVLTIADTKFGKTRLVPLHPSTCHALAGYRDCVARALGTPSAPALFVSTVGTRLLYKNVHRLIHDLITQAGITPRSTGCRPRIHDLRHSFAVNTMSDAYRDKKNPAEVLPVLSTYLGHADPSSTYWYLEATPHLLAQAATRLDHDEQVHS